MKIVRVFFVGIPIATCSLYLSKSTGKNNVSFSALARAQASQRSLQLEQVQVLFRHAARTPIKSEKEFDNFTNLDAVVWDKERFAKVLPHVDIDYILKTVDGDDVIEEKPHSNYLPLPGGCNGGDLTTTGQEEAYEFGNWLANEYMTKHALISPTYTNDAVYIRSTNTHRSVFTAVDVMAGLYAKGNLSEPVIIHSKRTNENIYPNWSQCTKIKKRFVYYWNVVKNGQEDINHEMGVKDGARLYNFVEIHDIIAQRKHHGLFVPKYLLDKEKEIAEHAMALVLEILGNANVSQLRNSIGSFVEAISCEISDAIVGTCKRKVIFYASHDTTIICFLSVLGIFDNLWPPFVANIIVELYKDDNGKRFIRVLHNREVVILDKDSGEEFLPVEKFMKLIEKYRVVNWDEDCGNT